MSENSPLSPHPLREERWRQGWSQQELADRLGTTVVTIKRWERGTQQPGAYFRVRLCALFGKSEEELGLRKYKEQEIAATALPIHTLLPLAPSSDTTLLTPSDEEGQTSRGEPSGEKERKRITVPLPQNTSLFSNHTYFVDFPALIMRNKRGVLGLAIVLIMIGTCTIFFVHAPILPWSTSQALVARPPQHVTHPAKSPLGIGELVGILTLNDPLERQNPQSSWQTGGDCTFQDGGYHFRSVGINYCSANTPSFGDFAYQIETEVLQGVQAGIVFRADADSHLYYFHVDVQGHYGLDVVNAPRPLKTLISGASAFIMQGYKHFNLLTVVARGSAISLWINSQQVGQVQDKAIDEGHVGIAVGSYYDADQSTVTVALFRQAKVWEQLSIV